MLAMFTTMRTLFRRRAGFTSCRLDQAIYILAGEGRLTVDHQWQLLALPYIPISVFWDGIGVRQNAMIWIPGTLNQVM